MTPPENGTRAGRVNPVISCWARSLYVARRPELRSHTYSGLHRHMVTKDSEQTGRLRRSENVAAWITTSRSSPAFMTSCTGKLALRTLRCATPWRLLDA